MAFFSWSKTDASNATADATVNWAEGQAPSTVNNSARAMMARTAEFRDDTSGTLVAGGTASAYTLTTNQVFTSASTMNAQQVTFIATADNAAGVTITVDGLGPYPVMVNSTMALPAGSFITGGVYTATFYSAVSQWRVRSFYINPYNIPLGAGMDYWGATVPNSNFAFPIGQAISRTTYATLFALMGTTHGVGDGSTTFNLPDKRERVSVMKAGAASLLTATYFGGDSTSLGATGGSESQTLTTAQLAVTTPAGTVSATTAQGTISAITPAGTVSAVTPSGTISAITPAGTISAITPAGSVSVTSTVSTIVKNTGLVSSATTSGGVQGIFADVNAVSVSSITSTGSLTGTPTTPTFTGTPTTPTFTGSASSAPTFTGTPTTPTFTGSASAAPTFTGSSFGSGSPHNNVQPTIVCNYIMRII